MPDAYDRIAERLKVDHLEIFGAFHPDPARDDLKGIGTLALLGPAEPGFWAFVSASPEFTAGSPDPLDRWSERVISAVAGDLGATPFFPFGRPPYRPFIDWALRSRRAWASPVGMLVHDRAGLMVSFRGALGLASRIRLPAPPAKPCASCRDKPCLSACPAGALGNGDYDVTACHAHLDRASGADCLGRGCTARRACPVSRAYGRLPQQSAFHMRTFHP